MRALKPSMREHKRYLLIKGNIGDIEKSILSFIGILGMSQVGLVWVKKSRESAVIGVNREMLDKVRASFAVWKNEILVEKVSGTIKGLGLGEK